MERLGRSCSTAMMPFVRRRPRVLSITPAPLELRPLPESGPFVHCPDREVPHRPAQEGHIIGESSLASLFCLSIMVDYRRDSRTWLEAGDAMSGGARAEPCLTDAAPRGRSRHAGRD